MESIRELFKIGHGPSSSHTIGPRKAAQLFLGENSNAEKFKVTLFGSLAATGKGHLTDEAVMDELGEEKTEILFKPGIVMKEHSNAMLFEALSEDGTVLNSETFFSVGGGKIVTKDTFDQLEEKKIIYKISTMEEILDHINKTGQSFWEFVEEHEGEEIWEYLLEVWKVMKDSVKRGLSKEGLLPGGLGLQRKASSYSIKASGFRGSLKRRSMLFAYALAVAEENASGGKVVTAPTCGSSGVLPGVLYNMSVNYKFNEDKILRALATAGLIGNLVKKNASISGAKVGCQGEIGTACAMAAAAAAQLFGGTPNQIEYAAEMGLEHHLGLTCDPVCGLVQIPCIERNAFAASRALDANTFALLSDGKHTISFDTIVETMNRTGNDLPMIYKETSEGGLAVTAKR
ncbi:MAG TPA: L-serine ammonia-lyase [bacterium]|jgi:L-serine dehydratase|nr:L-serine ammonia-lyase [bacterium]MDX9805528.1 L-serine ammonia-lyase [bacterium]HOG43353.1 L-serine ammonia-lyase [bacterium]HPV21628.1 L-serine ammonia-lyase [bacterium]HPY15667.1 L-serine ammonia-lyase [bacterium]